MPSYSVLRDLAQTTTAGPFEAAFGPQVSVAVPSEPRLDVEDLSKTDVQTLARDPQVRAIAPIMPTTLVQPFEVSDAEAAETAWGIKAVGADMSSRSGAGVVVCVLDTGIDSEHPAFAGVTLVQEDFSGSGNGDKQGHGTHCAGTIFGRDVHGIRIGVAPSVSKSADRQGAQRRRQRRFGHDLHGPQARRTAGRGGQAGEELLACGVISARKDRRTPTRPRCRRR
jgi:subtilisin family serine protease